jgi:hypothetical protein
MADTTTTNIPTTDPALLAAQAKAGQAGVDAYQAAIASMQQQRQSAVDQAMKEAALRGSPGGAVGSIASTIAAPYDQRTASLTQGLGNYQAAVAGGQQRLSDFNAAVNSARSLIPGQVELAVAPIRAETSFKVAQIGQAGREKVDEIDAQTRLAQIQLEAAKAKAAAAARGRGGGGGGGGGKAAAISASNLKSALAEGAQQQLAPYQQAASGGDVSGMAGTEGEGSQGLVSRGDVNFAVSGARYAGQAAKDYAQQVANQQKGPGLFGGIVNALKQKLNLNVPTAPAVPAWAQQGAGQALAEQNAAAAQGPTGSFNPLQQARMNALQQIVMAPKLDRPSTAPLQPLAQSPMQIATDALKKAMGGRTSFPTIALPGNYQQATGMGRTGSREAVSEMLGQPFTGGPGWLGDQSGPQQMPGASDVMRQAMFSAIPAVQAAGFKVTDPAVLATMATKSGIYQPGDTLADVLARQSGLDVPQDVIKENAKANTAAERAASTPAAQRATQTWEKSQGLDQMRENFANQPTTMGVSLPALSNKTGLTEAAIAEATASKDFASALAAVRAAQPKTDADVEKLVRGYPDPIRTIVRGILLVGLPSAPLASSSSGPLAFGGS